MCAQNAASEAVMTAEGLEMNGVFFKNIVEKCEGCGRVREVQGQSFCSSYANPASKWSLGVCNFATHAKVATTGDKVKVNPLKAAKRAAKGK